MILVLAIRSRLKEWYSKSSKPLLTFISKMLSAICKLIFNEICRTNSGLTTRSMSQCVAIERGGEMTFDPSDYTGYGLVPYSSPYLRSISSPFDRLITQTDRSMERLAETDPSAFEYIRKLELRTQKEMRAIQAADQNARIISRSVGQSLVSLVAQGALDGGGEIGTKFTVRETVPGTSGWFCGPEVAHLDVEVRIWRNKPK